MTFVGGNRSCIGFKFAQIEMSASPSPPSVQPRTLTPARRGRPRGAPRELRLRARPRAPHLLERLRDRLPERGQGQRQARDVAQGPPRRRVSRRARAVREISSTVRERLRWARLAPCRAVLCCLLTVLSTHTHLLYTTSPTNQIPPRAPSPGPTPTPTPRSLDATTK